MPTTMLMVVSAVSMWPFDPSGLRWLRCLQRLVCIQLNRSLGNRSGVVRRLIATRRLVPGRRAGFGEIARVVSLASSSDRIADLAQAVLGQAL